MVNVYTAVMGNSQSVINTVINTVTRLLTGTVDQSVGDPLATVSYSYRGQNAGDRDPTVWSTLGLGDR